MVARALRIKRVADLLEKYCKGLGPWRGQIEAIETPLST